jgi:hypothetical protein
MNLGKTNKNKFCLKQNFVYTGSAHAKSLK